MFSSWRDRAGWLTMPAGSNDESVDANADDEEQDNCGRYDGDNGAAGMGNGQKLHAWKVRSVDRASDRSEVPYLHWLLSCINAGIERCSESLREV